MAGDEFSSSLSTGKPLFHGDRTLYPEFRDRYESWAGDAEDRMHSSRTEEQRAQRLYTASKQCFPLGSAARAEYERIDEAVMAATAPEPPPHDAEGGADAEEDRPPPGLAQRSWVAAYALFWRMMDAQYATPGPSNLAAFRALRRKEPETVEMWGQRVSHAYKLCGEMLTIREAEAKFLTGLDNELRSIAEHWALTNPVIDQASLRAAVGHYQTLSHNRELKRGTLLADTGNPSARKSHDELIGTLDLTNRALLSKLGKELGKHGLALQVPGSAPQRPQQPHRPPALAAAPQPSHTTPYAPSPRPAAGSARCDACGRVGGHAPACQYARRAQLQQELAQHQQQVSELQRQLQLTRSPSAPQNTTRVSFQDKGKAPVAAAARPPSEPGDPWHNNTPANLPDPWSEDYSACAVAAAPTVPRPKAEGRWHKGKRSYKPGKPRATDPAYEAPQALAVSAAVPQHAAAATHRELPASFKPLTPTTGPTSAPANPARGGGPQRSTSPARAPVHTASPPRPSAPQEGDSHGGTASTTAVHLLARAATMQAQAAELTAQAMLELTGREDKVPPALAAAMDGSPTSPPPAPPRAADAAAFPPAEPEDDWFTFQKVPPPLTERELAEYNVSNDALLYFPHDRCAAENLSVQANGKTLATRNALVDLGAGIILVSADYCRKHNLEVDESPVHLSNATGGPAKVRGHLRTPLNLVLFAGTPDQASVTVGGDPGSANHVPALVAEGVAHLYDVLLGNTFTRRVGGEVSTFTSSFACRPFLQARGDFATLRYIPLRMHALTATQRGALLASRYFAACATSTAGPAAPQPQHAAGAPEPPGAPPHTAVRTRARALPKYRRPTLPTLIFALLLAGCSSLLLAPQAVWCAIPPLGLVPLLVAAVTRFPRPPIRGGGVRARSRCRLMLLTLMLLACTCLAASTASLTGATTVQVTSNLAGGVGAAAWQQHDLTPQYAGEPHPDPQVAAWAAEAASAAESPQLSALAQRVGSAVARSLPSPSSLVQSTMPEGDRALLGEDYLTDPEHGWSLGKHPEVTPEQQEQLRALLLRNRPSFAYSVADLPGYTGEVGPFVLEFTDSEPSMERPRKYSRLEQEVMAEKFGDLCQAGIIAQQQGPTRYASCPVIAAKKNADGEWVDKRACIDYRRVNLKTQPDPYRMKLPEELFEEVGSCSFVTRLDMRAGFHQIPVAPESQDKTTFWWGNQLYKYKRLGFGLRNATAHFQRVMDHELMTAGVTGHAGCFVDDVLIYSETFDQHLQHLDQALSRLHQVGLRVHPDKSVFASASVEFLGHVVSAYGMSPHDAKTKAISAMPAPRNVADLRSVLGLFNYYRCYVPNFSTHAQPLNDLLKKEAPWQWSHTQEQGFHTLKTELCTEGRALRRAQRDLPFILYTDWSKLGVGAVLAQVHSDGREYMICCISRSLNKHEANYSSYEGEMLACVWAVKTLRHYLHGVPFRIVTDHQPLTWLMTSQTLTGKYARWALALQDHDFAITHRPGKSHANADVPSRLPLGSAFDGTGARLDGAPNDPPYVALALPSLNPLIGATLALASRPCPTAPPAQTDGMVLAHAALSVAPPHGTQWDLGLIEACAVVHPSDAPQATHLRHAAARCALRAMQDPSPPRQRPPLRSSTHAPLDTSPVPSQLFTDSLTSGVMVIELCGGICAGLEALLQNGTIVRRYLYADTDPAARLAAQHRVQDLAMRFPQQLRPDQAGAMLLLPQDIREISAQALDGLALDPALPAIVIAGWPCQDLSPAGTGSGLGGQRSGLLSHVLRIIATLQDLHPAPVAYVLENVALQHNFKHPAVSVQAMQAVHTWLGPPICLDAAQFGARAHRLRNFWTNLAPPHAVERAISFWERPPGLSVDNILDPGRCAQLARRDSSAPFHPTNTKGEPLCALPTLMATPASYAFRNGGQGMVWDQHRYRLVEPNASERERAMGYATNSTAAPTLTDRQRCSLLGNAIDQHALQALIATCRAVALVAPEPLPTRPTPALPTACALGGEDTHAVPPDPRVPTECLQPEDKGRDIWTDESSLYYLKHGRLPESIPRQERKRIIKRARGYLMVGSTLWRQLPDGNRREVPQPHAREQLVLDTHCNTGHFGERRTLSLLKAAYWWSGMGEDTARLVGQCELCDRVRASFNSPTAQLHPLAIQGLFYRWGMDLAGPFPVTPDGNKFLAICIEHFSKHLALIPLPSKEPHHTATAFRCQVLCKFGSCAEVVTDGGGEFEGEFDELLRDSLIDHRVTSPNHPQADGLAERAVQTTKRALRKAVEQAQNATNWDTHLVPYIALGYNASVQQSSGFSPYFILHGVSPVVPPAVKERLEPPLDLNDPELAQALLTRAAAMRQAGVIAAGNLAIAQHRDTARYATVRSGTYHPRLRRYEVGDFVRLRVGEPNHSLDTSHYARILRVREVRPEGILLLEGADGRTVTDNVVNCAPCHLPFFEEPDNAAPARPSATLPCEVCGYPDREEVMLLCDACNTGWHTFCLQPALAELPPQDQAWVCPRCEQKGVTADTLTCPPDPAPEPRRHSLFPSASTKGRDENARQLDGARVSVKGHEGTAHFISADRRPYYFDIEFDSGETHELCSAVFVRRRLLAATAAAAAAAAAPGTPPSQWDLTHPEGVLSALQALMPGTWSAGHATKLASQLKAAALRPGLAPLTPTDPQEVTPLLATLDLTQVGSILDPWAGGCTIRQVLAASGLAVVDNDLNPSSPALWHADALQPAFYARAAARMRIGAIVTSPWFSTLDLALPLAVAAARMVACVHVPGYFITDAHPNRAAYLRSLMQEGRLHVLWNLPKGPMGRRCGWLLIFASAKVKQLLLRADGLVSGSFSLA